MIKLICPNCQDVIREIEVTTDKERSYFDEEELRTGVAVHHQPCETCKNNE